MDTTFRTPLLDCFRRGEAPPEVRQLAAEGRLAPRAHEQLALLVLLSEDPDPQIRATADRTIARLPADPLAAFLARSDVNPDMRAFFASRGISVGTTPAADTSAPLLEEPGEDPAESRTARAGSPAAPKDGNRHETAPQEEDSTRLGSAQRLALMSVSERMKVAFQGSREERNILIRDSNRLVAAAVLSSPKLSDSEVEAISRMPNVSDEVLRIVGTTRAWVKNYNVIAALTRNAKTPIAITLTLLPRLTARDVRMLSLDRNVPEPLRVAARKLVSLGDSRKK